MIGVVIGASIDAIHAIDCAKGMGIYVVAIDGDKEAQGLKVADKAIVADIKDKDLICNILREITPDFTIPVPIGRYLTTLGYVNDYFNLKGISYDATELCTDKYLFHKKLNNQGLRQIESYLIKDKYDYLEKEFIYPVIVKPRFGSGSRGVALISSKKELHENLKNEKFEEDFIIEDAVAGVEYGVDGAVLNGKLKIVLVRKKIITPEPARQCVGYFAVIDLKINTELSRKIEGFLEDVIKEIGLNNCIFHVDLIINENNIFIIEISGRPSGHYLHNIFTPYVTGVDMVEEYIKFETDGTGNFIPQEIKVSAIHYFNFEDCIVDYVPTLDEIIYKTNCNIIDYQCNIKEGDWLGTVKTGYSIMERGYFIVCGEDEKHLISQINQILECFKLRKQGV